MVGGPGMVHRCATSYRGPSRIELLPRLVAYPSIWLHEPICGIGYDEDVVDDVELERTLGEVRSAMLGSDSPAADGVEQQHSSSAQHSKAQPGKAGELKVGVGTEGGAPVWSSEAQHKKLLERLETTPLRTTSAVTWWSHSWPDQVRPHKFGVVGKFFDF